jgi:hypothetical protein
LDTADVDPGIDMAAHSSPAVLNIRRESIIWRLNPIKIAGLLCLLKLQNFERFFWKSASKYFWEISLSKGVVL